MSRIRLAIALLLAAPAASAHEIRLQGALALGCNEGSVTIEDRSAPASRWDMRIELTVVDLQSGESFTAEEEFMDEYFGGVACVNCFPGRNKRLVSDLYLDFDGNQPHDLGSLQDYLENSYCDPGYAHQGHGAFLSRCRRDEVSDESCTILTSAPLSRIDNEPVSKIVSATPAGDPVETAHENIRRLAHYRSTLDPLRLAGLPRHCESIGSNASGFETSPGVLSGRNFYYRCGTDFVTLQLTEQSERNARNLADNANAYIGGRPAILHAARPAAGGLSLTAAWERDGLDFWSTIESPTAQDEDVLAETLGGVTAIRGAGSHTP